MLRKLISLALLLLLTGCNREGVSANLYVNSLGFDYDGEYTVYLYASSSFDNVLNEMQKDETNPQIGVAKGENLVDCLTQLETSMYERINYEHIKSIIFTHSFLDEERIEEVILYLGNKHRFSIDFCFFITENIEDVYSIKTMDEANSDNFVFLNPVSNNTLYDNVSYTDFVSSFYEKYRGIRIPVLKVKEGVWQNGENKKVLIIDEVMYYNQGETYYLKDEYIHYANNFETKIIKIGEVVVNLKEYRLDIVTSKDGVKLAAFTEAIIVINKDDLSDLEVMGMVKEEINKQMLLLIELNKKVDFLNVRDFLYRRGKSIENIKYDIDINIQK